MLLISYLKFALKIALVAVLFCNIGFAYEQSETKPKAAKQFTTINVGVLFSAKGHRGFYRELIDQFQTINPNIKVRYTGLLDAELKLQAPIWLSEEGGMDVIYWQAGERLFHYTRQGLIHPLDNIWQQEQFNQKFPSTIISAVSENGHVYALPFAYYTWGMFYNDKVLTKLDIEVPQNWAEFKNMCLIARDNNLVPIMIGSKDPWFPAAWFDYINLRLNGLGFHQQLLNGEISFKDDRVRKVFEHWAELINANCFAKTHKELTWRGVIPPLLRQMAVTTLVANFVDLDMPTQFKSDISYHPFPAITPELPQYEDIPVDVFVIPKASTKKQAAEKLIAFLGKPKVQSMMSNAIGQSTPHIEAEDAIGYFARQNKNILQSTAGLAQFYDRDMQQHLVGESLAIIGQFLSTADVEDTISALEQLRIKPVLAQ